jgi:hypothetical protein
MDTILLVSGQKSNRFNLGYRNLLAQHSVCVFWAIFAEAAVSQFDQRPNSSKGGTILVNME